MSVHGLLDLLNKFFWEKVRCEAVPSTLLVFSSPEPKAHKVSL